MLFDTDKQTIKDLNLFEERTKEKSVFSVYNRTTTKGGLEMMYKLFHTPVADIELLQCRKEEINFFFEHDCVLKLKSRSIDFIEHYLTNDRVPLRNNIIDATFNGIKNKISADGDYWIISNGIIHAIRLLVDLKSLIKETASLGIPATLQEDLSRINAFVAWEPIKSNLFYPPEDVKDLSFVQINNIDHFIRSTKKVEFRELLNIVYKIDVLQTLGGIMKTDGFTLPEYSSQSEPLFEATDAFYPVLTAPIPNSFSFGHNSNLCFITGPNMAGKSTFLKTMVLMVYLSHLGFPVPAKKLKTTVFDGLFTTINLADNLNLGYSHFYSEVKRVKDIVAKINTEQHFKRWRIERTHRNDDY
jgi:DNA mismatch repair protein MutS